MYDRLSPTNSQRVVAALIRFPVSTPSLTLLCVAGEEDEEAAAFFSPAAGVLRIAPPHALRHVVLEPAEQGEDTTTLLKQRSVLRLAPEQRAHGAYAAAYTVRVAAHRRWSMLPSLPRVHVTLDDAHAGPPSVAAPMDEALVGGGYDEEAVPPWVYIREVLVRMHPRAYREQRVTLQFVKHEDGHEELVVSE